jgi:hypothetical protein
MTRSSNGETSLHGLFVTKLDLSLLLLSLLLLKKYLSVSPKLA